jgi:hypothetical protein
LGTVGRAFAALATTWFLSFGGLTSATITLAAKKTRIAAPIHLRVRERRNPLRWGLPLLDRLPALVS